jgi:hypothetical protein
MRDADRVIHDILDMHQELMNNKRYELEKLGHDFADLQNRIQENSNVIQRGPMTYNLDAITMASKVAMGDGDRHYPSKKLQAIKAVRDEFGYTIREAKDLVEAVCAGYNNPYPHEGG